MKSEILNINDNELISKMDSISLEELFKYLDNYFLKLRPVLNFDKSITFGVEIECEYAQKDKIVSGLCQKGYNGNWDLVYDNTLCDGMEITSSILRDNDVVWKQLDDVCCLIKSGAVVGQNTGGHIHIGAQIFENSRENLLNFVKLWAVYENIVFRFCYGNYLTPRSSICNYAFPISLRLLKDYKKITVLSLSEMIKELDYGRYASVNFKNITNFEKFIYGNTIEFRCPNGTFDAVIWQNNINLFVNMLKYAKGGSFDSELINFRCANNTGIFSNIEYYNNINLAQALEFCDMVFNNNLDKLYFLRQYLKSFEVGNESLQLAKTFITR